MILELIRKHWPAIAAFLVMLALVCWAYLQGQSTGRAECTARYESILAERDRVSAQALADALAAAHAQAQEALEMERQHLAAQGKTDQQFKIITNTVKEYIHATPDLDRCGLDAIGLRYWNGANRGGIAAPASNP